jgi:hypothetical protein
MAGVLFMAFDGSYYNSKRPGSGEDAAQHVANEIFNHNLQSAAYDVQRALRGRNSQQADAFVQHVNLDLQRMNEQYGYGASSHLATRDMGNGYETVALTNGQQSRGIAQVPENGFDNFANPNNGNLPFDRQAYQNGFNQYGGDTAGRVANEIFSGHLRDAQMDISQNMRGRSAGDLSAFANAVNGRLEQMAAERGMQQERLANYLSVHQIYRNGMSGEALAMTNGYQHKDVVAAPLGRNGLNYDAMAQNGLPPNYYDNGIQNASYMPQDVPPPPVIYPGGYPYPRYAYNSYPYNYGGYNYGGVNPAAYAGGSLLRVAVGALTHGRVWI